MTYQRKKSPVKADIREVILFHEQNTRIGVILFIGSVVLLDYCRLRRFRTSYLASSLRIASSMAAVWARGCDTLPEKDDNRNRHESFLEFTGEVTDN